MINLPTIIVAAIIAVIVIAIIVNLIRKRKKGISSCSCGGSCSGCANSGICHSQTKSK